MFGLTFSRWYLFIAAFAVQFCIGCIYAWSVLNHPIDLAVYGDAKKGRAVNAFYIAMGVFGTAAAVLGPTIERKGPRWAVSIGTTLFMTGHIVTAIGIHYKTIACIYIGYGIITAIGLGMCYISPVSTLQKWFPDYRGTAAGFAVAGSGAGSVVWSKTPTGADQPEMIDTFTFFVIEIFVLTASYGGGLGTIPALVTDMFGAYNVGPLHGIILTSLAFGAVVGGITFNNAYNGKIADGMSVGEAYIDNIQVIFVIVVIGFVVLFLVRTNVKDRFEPGYHYSLCGKRVISIPPKEKDVKQDGVENETEGQNPILFEID
eukprot:jgi/Phyca11/13642/fgenesh1_pg.PHYCAscaffold_4_\